MPTIAVYRDVILPFPETFISNQALGLRTHRALLVGLERRRSAIALPEDRILVCAPGRWGRGVGELVRRLRWLPPWWIAAITTHRPALIHAHYAVDACHALPIAKRLGVPLVVTCHGYDVAQDEDRIRKPSPTWKRYLRRRQELYQHADRFIAVSTYIRTCMLAKGFPAERITVLPIGIDTAVFDGISDRRDPNTVLFVGRVDPDKGIHDLLTAMTQVKARLPRARLEVIGGGSQLSAAQELAATLPFETVFYGPCAQAVVRDRLRSCTLLCVPSRTGASGAQEALGLVFGEAQAMRVPVVTYRIGGIPEIVQHGTTGLLVTEGDVAGLADAITTILADRTMQEHMGEAGRTKIVESYALSDCIVRLEKFYDDVIAGRPRVADDHDTSISISQTR